MTGTDVTPTTAGQLDLIDGHGLAEQVERVATFRELAAATMAERVPKNTTRAFSGDWDLWLAFWVDAEHGGHGEAQPTLADPDNLVVFAKWMAQGGRLPDGRPRKSAAPESMRRRLTGVLHGWETRGVQYPRGITKQARRWIARYEQELVERNASTGRGKAHPLTVRDLRALVEACPDDLGGLRDRALVLMHFGIGDRRSELAFLDVSDITRTDDGLEVHVRKSKTGERRPALVHGQHAETCPVRAWQRWQQRSAIVTGAAFRTVDRHGNLGHRMSGEAVGAVITRAGQRAGLSHRLTGHSPRRGLATEARRAGHSLEQIADQGGWQRDSRALHGYIESVDKWTNNVLAGMGL